MAPGLGYYVTQSVGLDRLLACSPMASLMFLIWKWAELLLYVLSESAREINLSVASNLKSVQCGR